MSDHGPTVAQMEILNHLKQVGHSSAKQIAAVQDVTPMSVRSHLTPFEKAGLVRITLDRRATGRPTHIYSLTEQARKVVPDDYEALVAEFIRCGSGVGWKREA
jgi:predicted ArsR family transcriptional regulator